MSSSAPPLRPQPRAVSFHLEPEERGGRNPEGRRQAGGLSGEEGRPCGEGRRQSGEGRPNGGWRRTSGDERISGNGRKPSGDGRRPSGEVRKEVTLVGQVQNLGRRISRKFSLALGLTGPS